MMGSTFKKIGMVALVLVIFLVYMKFNDYKTKHFKVNAKTFHVQSSKADLLKDEFSAMPLLEPANQYHIMMDESVDVPLVNMQRTLHIEKAWLNEGFLYVLYSIDLRNSDKTLTDVPTLSFNKIRLHFSNGKTVDVTTNEDPSVNTPSRLTYNYKVYDEKLLGLEVDPGALQLKGNENYMDVLNKIDKATLLDPTLEVKGQPKTSLSNISFPVKLNQDKYYVGSNPINKEMKVKGTTIQFTKVKKYYDHDELEFKTLNNKKHLVNLTYQFRPADGDSSPVDKFLPGDTTSLDFNSHSAYMEDSGDRVQIIPQKVSYKLNKSIKFTITPEMFKKLSTNYGEEKVADIPGGHIYFGIEMEEDGFFYLGFKSDSRNEAQPTAYEFVSKNFASKMSKEARDQTTFITFTTLDGKSIDLDTPDQFSTDEGTGETKTFFSRPNADSPEKGFKVEIDGLIYEEPVNTNPITISLK
ncbi:hypothetical protein PU629_03810 [Pullulanibacillus sp. KACC 23026]|uniref:hypothetical protein n=1 Tax=Pullulanibacillus sp. KACC 23026 TaxID=3028315 RepID=UPI0023AF17FE|nr:hypothetical protein [Pullulanibacillus sp. KACC 23026]WEG13504.1 hypothetical protein PU629_03810 [Pullulanibacillus sp. KACC 23026]